MNSLARMLVWFCLMPAVVWADAAESAATVGAKGPPSTGAGLLFRDVGYRGRVRDEEARFTVELTAEALGTGEAAQPLFEGELALLPPKLPPGLRLERAGNQYRLVASKRGEYPLKVELVAKISRAEPWNQVSFKGPAAPIATLSAEASGKNIELQLLNGTLLETSQTNGAARIKALLGADQVVGLRWSLAGGTAAVARKAVVTAETTATAQITPTVVKHVTQLHYEVLQGKLPRLTIALPASHALTRLTGEQIRDWEIKGGQASGAPASAGLNADPAKADAGNTAAPKPAEVGAPGQILTVEFLKPVDKEYQLTLYSEQPIEAMPSGASLTPPQPLELERESGLLTVSTEDVVAEIAAAPGLRQVNAPASALAAYRFNGRPFNLDLKLKRIEPAIKVADRVNARLEETRLLITHALTLEVEKAGIYALDLRPQAGCAAAEVRGEGLEDWKLADAPGGSGKVLRVSFSSRVLGTRLIEVQLEQPWKNFPEQVAIAALRVPGAAQETAQIGAAAAPGLRLKTAELAGVREIPASRLAGNGASLPPVSSAALSGTPGAQAESRMPAPLFAGDDTLAYSAEQPAWTLTLATERLAPRVVAEIFNLVTIGDGIVGGSATIRYGLVNQGVQEFAVAVPATWKNVEFTGPNIRRKEPKGDGLWTIGLQDKAWGGYTLVVTYDFQFDPKGATLNVGGIHAVGAERESGSVALTTAASFKLDAKTAELPLQRIDETELAPTDRALITRAVLLAYQYSGAAYELAVEVKRFDELPVLSAVADRTQLTTVLTEAGELLTEASFMVKNNDKQFQRFKLPAGATFWSCQVNGQPVKAERDQDWLMAPLPRTANRDQAFAVDIVYAEKKVLAPALFPHALRLEAPQTDVPNTYAEWQLNAPPAFRLSNFGGNMTVARGTTYDWRDAWMRFIGFYDDFVREAGPGLFFIGALVVLVVAIVGSAVRRGWSGVFGVLAVFCIVGLLAAMLLPALSKAKARAQRISAVNNLKQIGLAMKTWSLDNSDNFPASYEDMMNELGTDKVTIDPESGQRFVYVGAGKSDVEPQAVVAYSPTDAGGYRAVLFADGSVEQMSCERFAELSRRGLTAPATPEQAARSRQVAAVREQQGLAGTAVRHDLITGQAGAPAPAVQAAPARAGGARAIRIEIPRTGQSFAFTKVLNVSKDPLRVQASFMRWQTFQTIQMVVQLAGFVAGLLLWWWQWRRTHRNSFLLTLALALALGSVGNLFLAWRLLHLVLIWTAPLFALAVVAWLTWRFWPRKASGPPPIAPPLESALPPAATLIVLALSALSFVPASARERESCPGGTYDNEQRHPGALLPCAPRRSRTAPLQSTNPPIHQATPPSPPALSILSATYTGAVNDRIAQVDAVIRVSAAKPDQKAFLFGDDVAVREFSAKPAEARLLREDNGFSVLLGRRGETTLQLKLVAKLSGDVTQRRLAFGIPAALNSQLALTIDQPEADVEFPAAISSQRTSTSQQTRVLALLGGGERVDLRWTPRVKRAAEIAANVICHNATLVTFGGGVINARARLDYQVTQGELKQARVRLPAGHRLLRVEGDAIRTWEVRTENSEQTLAVELLKGVTPNYRLTVETEKPLEPLPATVRTEIPHAVEVSRETGLLGLRADEELDLRVERAQELSRVDAEEFARASGQKIEGVLNAFRFLKPDFTLEARVAAQQPQLEAMVRHTVRVGPEQMSVSAAIDYTIKRAGVFALRLALPAEYRLESVTGSNLLQWAEQTEAGQRLLELTLKERTSGNYSLRLDLARNWKELPKLLPIAAPHPLGVQKLTGSISVLAEPGVAIQPATVDGLTEVPAASVAGNGPALSGNVLAYRFLAAEPQTAPVWKLALGTEAVESWVRAEIVNTLTLSDSLISGRALARFEIQNAPVKELRLQIPAAFRNVEISGPNIRRRDQEGEVWRIEFQNKLHGAHVLTITWDQPRDTATNRVQLRGVSAAGVERETGVLAVVARPPLQVTEAAAADLKPLDTRDLPEWAGRPDEATVLAYRYLRPGYTLALEAKRYEEAEVLQALAEKLNLTTVVADDGQMMTELSLAVRNRGRQHLEVTLPPGAKVWSAFVAGQPVRPSVREGKLLLPLERSIDEAAPLAVELTYVGATPFPQSHGAVALVSPQLDVPFQSARWELFLPPDYRYTDFTGTMSRETGRAAEAMSFSLLEYSRKESENRAEKAKAMKSELASAKRNLSKGNVKEALAEYNRALTKNSYAAKDADTRQLEEQLRRAQGSNLINAQNSFSVNNGVQMPGQPQALANLPAAQVQYDTSAAEAQWTKLQQAQELGAAKVQPIRVNLPTRGLRYAFTQVLQTEAGKPMTIRLLAANDKEISWPKRLLAGLGGFVFLWLLAAALARQPAKAPSE